MIDALIAIVGLIICAVYGLALLVFDVLVMTPIRMVILSLLRFVRQVSVKRTATQLDLAIFLP